jgi:hypothetical protein
MFADEVTPATSLILQHYRRWPHFAVHGAAAQAKE